MYDISLIFKSDLLKEFEIKKLDLLDLSLLDFAIAEAADIFIGNSRSTFSSHVLFELYCNDLHNSKNHYIYNVMGEYLIKRNDCGVYIDPNEIAISSRKIT
jgi:hypothetical protein